MARPKKKDEEKVHPNINSQTTQEQLRQFVESIERLQADAKAVADDIKEKFSEAKGCGFDTKILRRLIAERKRDQDEIAEEEAVLDIYRAAMGMGAYASSSDDDEEADDADSMV